MIKIFITHYSKLIERKENILKQFQLQNIDNYTFIELCNAEQLSQTDLNLFDFNSPILGDKKYIPNVISLFMKHIAVYNSIYHNDFEYALILEDDVILDNNFIEKLTTYLEETPKDFDALFIGNGCYLHIPEKDIVKDKHIYPCIRSKCTDSYVVSKSGAKKLLDFFENIHINSKVKIIHPIDHWLNMVFHEMKCNVFWAEPTIVKQGTQYNIFKSSLHD